MKSLFVLLFLLLVVQSASAQAFNSPESIEFDYARNRWLVSNNGSGEILAMSPAGVRSVFASGIPSGPHGLEIVEDTLYACDGSSLKAFDLNTGALVFNRNLGASFLNGITKDTAGQLYITDFSAKKIFRFNTKERSFSVLVANTVSTPNGIIYDKENHRCVFVNWGSAAPIKAVDLETASVNTLTTTNLGNCDGIARDGAGNYYVSSWSGGSKITRFNPGFTTSEVVVSTGLSNPADICYNLLTDTLAVPNSGAGNSITFHNFGSTTGTHPFQNRPDIKLVPNPCHETVAIQTNIQPVDNLEVGLFSALGKELKADLMQMENHIVLNTRALASGLYRVRIRCGPLVELKTLWVQ